MAEDESLLSWNKLLKCVCVCALVSKSANYRRRLCQKYKFFLFLRLIGKRDSLAMSVCARMKRKKQQSNEKNRQRHSQKPQLTFIEIRLSPMTKKSSEKKNSKIHKAQNCFTTLK